jgi:hypothetical protein
LFSFIHLFIHSFIHSFIYLFIYSLVLFDFYCLFCIRRSHFPFPNLFDVWSFHLVITSSNHPISQSLIFMFLLFHTFIISRSHDYHPFPVWHFITLYLSVVTFPSSHILRSSHFHFFAIGRVKSSHFCQYQEMEICSSHWIMKY